MIISTTLKIKHPRSPRALGKGISLGQANGRYSINSHSVLIYTILNFVKTEKFNVFDFLFII